MADSNPTTVQDVLASVGLSMVERTRLAFGATVLKSLADAEHVFVFFGDPGTTGATLSTIPGTIVHTIDDPNVDYPKLRAHVLNFAKSRKIKLAGTAVRDADGNATAAHFRKALA